MEHILQIPQQWKNYPNKSFRIIAFGSSNTELFWHSQGRHNWVDWLNINARENIGRHVSVINQGICGENSTDLINRIDRDVFSFNPSIVIVTIGGNDAVAGFSSKQYSDNLQRICEMIKKNNALPVLQTYYCPIYHEGIEGYKDIFESFVKINRDLAKVMDLPIIDQYRSFEPFYRNNKDAYKKLMLDWLHVNHFGNLIMGLNVSKVFGLPDFPIPEDIEQNTKNLIAQMCDYYEK